MVSFNCGQARDLGFDARHEPERNNPAHAHLYCDGTPAKQRKKNAQRLAPGVCGCLRTGVFRVMLLLRSHSSDGLPGPPVLLLQHFIQDVGIQNGGLHTLTRQYGRDRLA